MDCHFHPPKWSEKTVHIPEWWDSNPPHQVHLVPSMSLGGAERIVVDLATEWAKHGMTADIVTLHDAPSTHILNAPGITLHQLHTLSWNDRLDRAAEIVKKSNFPAYCHIIGPSAFKRLWELGCQTIPVVHNARSGWGEDPTLWDHELVPYVIACGDFVANDIAQTTLSKPVKVIRHMVPKPSIMTAEQRLKIRAAFGVNNDTILIGMIGRIVPQKRYTRAVRILAELLNTGIKAKLVIIGATRSQNGKIARDALEIEASNLGVRASIIMTGPIADARNLVGAFDIFLNTSIFEGVSIATMEAVASGVPVITADAGGQKEAIGPHDIIIPNDATDAEWVDSIIKTSCCSNRPLFEYDNRICHYNTWGWTNVFNAPNPNPPKCDILFVTGNMDVGGAQRSLCNLVTELPSYGINPIVAVCGQFGVPEFMEPALKTGVKFMDLSGGPQYLGHLRGRAGRVMSLAYNTNPKWIVFWNMDAASKITITKAMAGSTIKVCDVSPGPALYKELDTELDFGRAMSLIPDDYMASLDMLVSKYQDGGPDPKRKQPKTFRVIPNGVPIISSYLSDNDGPKPPIGYNPDLAVVTVCRLTQSKRPDLLPLVAKYLDNIVPGATLTVVGGVHNDNTIMIDPPKNLFFVGPDHRTTKFLHRFACFYMVSLDQGCPNASLEAMMAGLPIVANPNGGTNEQIENGINGYLVPDKDDPNQFAKDLAMALAKVILNKPLARTMGMVGQHKALVEFSMEKMVTSYIEAFGFGRRE